MINAEVHIVFQKKLGKNYANMVIGWLKLTPSELIGKAEEVAATALVLDLLPTTVTVQQMEYLLHFENPLEVVRDQWIEENGSAAVHDEDMIHALWSVADRGDAEQDYTLDPEYAPPMQRGPELC